ncbi:hypothetical protein [Kitasatospora purpeofusca]|uniref:hypothetical protein n=1 Tax=Kitasatospora purpeofusca TaxID=67352 RepID=UPI00386A366C|nr:hypothetical protein OIP63_38905 [Kitasatospora purpeofusca]
MTESALSGTAEPESRTDATAPVPAPASAAPSDTAAASRRMLRAGGATLAAALVGVAVGAGIIEVRYDDPAPVAAAPPPSAPTPSTTPFGAKSNGNHFGSLRDLLLPVPDDHDLGPDDGAYGNDTALTGDRLTAAFEDDLGPLPEEQREKLRQSWKDLHVKATGIRTYTNRQGNLVIGMKLHQFNQQEVQKADEFTAAFTGDTGIFRLGPAVPGHPEAHCYLPPAKPSAPIDRMTCSAAEGDLLVVMDAEGVAPLAKDRIVALFAQQLDRLARPGASA